MIIWFADVGILSLHVLPTLYPCALCCMEQSILFICSLKKYGWLVSCGKDLRSYQNGRMY